MDARSHHSNVGQLLWCDVGVARASDRSGRSLEVEGKNIEWSNEPEQYPMQYNTICFNYIGQHEKDL